jgi:phage/plasmid-like protein (TIGR03299 family)
MAYRGETPWHRLGERVEDFSLAAAREKVFTWDPKKAQCYYRNAAGEFLLAPGLYTVTRGAGGLAIGGDAAPGVGRVYRTLPASQFLGVLEGLEKFGAVAETAGILDEGRRWWALMRVEGGFAVGGDEMRPYVLASTAHDGSAQTCITPTFTRVVCANTLAIAMTEPARWKVRHTESQGETLYALRDMVAQLAPAFKQESAELRSLTTMPMSTADVDSFTEATFGLARKDGKLSTKAERIVREIRDLFVAGKGNRGETAWDVLNAVTEYVDHKRAAGRDAATRLASIGFGSGATLKARAREVLLRRAR